MKTKTSTQNRRARVRPRRTTGLDRYLIGSIADRVARLAPCPVVLVRPGKRSPDRKQKLPAVLRFKREGKSSR